jgi:hypothetical protein
MPSPTEPLQRTTALWLEKVKLAAERKDDEFGKYAKDAMRFYKGPYDFMYEHTYTNTSMAFVVEGVRAPAFRMSVNKVAELVQLFLPVLYHRNPVRTVTPRYLRLDPELIAASTPPQVIQAMLENAQQNGQPITSIEQLFPDDTTGQAQKHITAQLLEWYLNQAVQETDLKTQSRLAIVEALIKGRGVLWTELKMSAGKRLVHSIYDSVDHLELDPDAERIVDCKWVARKRAQAIVDVERRFGLKEGYIKGHRESYQRASEINTGELATYDRRTGRSYDILHYYEIYSRIGLGGHLAGASDDFREVLNLFGDHTYLAIAEGIPHPLNLPPDIFDESITEEELRQRVAWHTPFHEDSSHPWPFVQLDFHTVPRQVWPMSHITPALGELKALQWIMSFLVGKIKNISRDFVVIDKTIEEDIKEAIQNGPDLTMLEVLSKGNRGVEDMVSFIRHPELNNSIWEVVAALERNFDRRTGVTDLALGMPSGPQLRSATEAGYRQQNMSVRPDDMSNTTEDWQSQVAKNHAIAARFHLQAADIAPMFGETFDETAVIPLRGAEIPQMPPYTTRWMNYVMPRDIADLVHEFAFRIEAGSARKPNRAAELEKAQQALQVVAPVANQVYTMTGDPTMLNFILKHWYQANEWLDYEQGMAPDLTEMMAAMQQQQQQQTEQTPQRAPA